MERLQTSESVDIFVNKEGKLSEYKYQRNYLRLAGKVRAGGAVECFEEFEEIHIPYWLCENKQRSYALLVEGDSMIEAGILDGDYVVIDPDKGPRVGQIVLASVDGCQTLKEYRTKNGMIQLVPKNGDYSPVLGYDISLMGTMVGLLRKY